MSFFGGVVRGAKDAFNHVIGRPSDADRKAMNAQMRAYKDQTELNRKMLAEASAQKDVEKRRIEEKQIRALRRNYSARGLLGSAGGGASNNDSGMSPTLGG